LGIARVKSASHTHPPDIPSSTASRSFAQSVTDNIRTLNWPPGGPAVAGTVWDSGTNWEGSIVCVLSAKQIQWLAQMTHNEQKNKYLFY
jgi:hypothetical protein